MEIPFTECEKNTKFKISRIKYSGVTSQRLRELGIVAGVFIKIVGEAPFKDPIVVKYRGTVLSLRKSEASIIYVLKEG